MPDTLVLNNLNLQAQGDLHSGYTVNGTARLPAREAPMELRLEGRVTAQGANVDVLRLQAGDQQTLQLAGRLDWQEAFTVDAALDWQDFPWLRLYPIDEPPVSLRRMRARSALPGRQLSGTFRCRTARSGRAVQPGQPGERRP